MKRTVTIAALIAIAVIGAAAIGYELAYLHWFRSVVAQGYRAHLETTPAALEHELRASLPPGTSRGAVEAALQARRIEFSDDGTSRDRRAVAHYLKGSNPLTETSLSLVFRFDENDALATVNSFEVLTGRKLAP